MYIYYSKFSPRKSRWLVLDYFVAVSNLNTMTLYLVIFVVNQISSRIGNAFGAVLVDASLASPDAQIANECSRSADLSLSPMDIKMY